MFQTKTHLFRYGGFTTIGKILTYQHLASFPRYISQWHCDTVRIYQCILTYFHLPQKKYYSGVQRTEFKFNWTHLILQHLAKAQWHSQICHPPDYNRKTLLNPCLNLHPNSHCSHRLLSFPQFLLDMYNQPGPFYYSCPNNI